jgi:hypothetical protein
MTLGEPYIRSGRSGAEKYPLPCPESKHDSSACRDVVKLLDQIRYPITVYEKPDEVFGKNLYPNCDCNQHFTLEVSG